MPCQDMLWSVLPHQGHRLVIERSVSEPVMGGAFRLLVFAAGGSLALLVRAFIPCCVWQRTEKLPPQ